MALTLVTLFITSLFAFAYLQPLSLLEEDYQFKQWMSHHNKVYDTEEYFRRLRIFTENKKIVDGHNAETHSFTMGLNQFSDMTFEEFRKFFLLQEPQNCSATKGNHVGRSGPYPKSVDWRTKGNFVTPVKNQGHCGSCWTFSATGCLESVNAIATEKLISLSEQQLIDCAEGFNNQGCMGGLPSQAFEYIKYSKGLMTEEDYPYKGYDDTCHFDPALAAVFVHDVVNITSSFLEGKAKSHFQYFKGWNSSMYDEQAMVDAVARLNPVTFGFEVTDDFMQYKDGVYTSTLCKNKADSVNHAVLAVGYGVDDGATPYWIVKNSWGATWGTDGYFLIERGKNMCGLATCASYPLPLV